MCFAADADHTPIKVGEFSEKIALVRAEDDEGLEDEYAVRLQGVVWVAGVDSGLVDWCE